MTADGASRSAVPPASGTVAYVYCVVPAEFDASGGITGIGGEGVRLVTSGDLAALVSTLDGAAYGEGTIEQRASDIAWLESHAVAHDRVVTWASDRAPAVPMPMWTLFADDDGVRAELQARAGVLRAYLETLRNAREYTVRVFVSAGDFASSLVSLSPRLSELERSADQAGPGQAYLLRRKLEAERKLEGRAVARRIGDETYDALAEWAAAAVREPIPPEAEKHAVLNASFLVRNERYDDFRRALTTLVTRYQGAGVRFDFTGPWPAYHFVRGE